MNLPSQQAWKKVIAPIYQQVVAHPFNQELIRGTLSPQTFCYYLEQDGFYLQKLAHCLTLLQQHPNVAEHIKKLFTSLIGALQTEQNLHNYLKKKFAYQPREKFTSASIAYTNHIVQHATKNLALGMASLLPCFWLYQEVGIYIAKHATPNNPFEKWIETYGGNEFVDITKQAINIFDELAENNSQDIQQTMLDIVHQSAMFELRFVDDIYSNYELRIINHES